MAGLSSTLGFEASLQGAADEFGLGRCKADWSAKDAATIVLLPLHVSHSVIETAGRMLHECANEHSLAARLRRTRAHRYPALAHIYDSLQPLAANIAVAESAASAQAVKH
ncbi:hypothetical protein AXG89_01875 [Burkholderia sp. PAMC 26561]|jgi:hypothetical protein|nr:hypothetical protein AXG89_01875 [Burkholderia sp. PAMC 26561]